MTGTPTGAGASGGAGTTASAPSPRAYAHTGPEDWDRWYAGITALSADINLLRTVGKALHRAKALDPGDWDDEPGRGSVLPKPDRAHCTLGCGPPSAPALPHSGGWVGVFVLVSPSLTGFS